MNSTLASILVCALLVAGMLVSAWAGHRAARRARGAAPSPEASQLIVGAIFALLGLLVAFTFSAAFSRLDARRQLIVHEADAIGTAWLRLDLLPPDAQPPLRDKFRAYTTGRARTFEVIGDEERTRAVTAETAALQRAIWSEAVAATAGADYRPMRVLVLPALNDMFDITTTRAAAMQTHSPLLVFTTLFLIAIVCTALAAFTAQGKLSRVQLGAFILVTAFTLFVILDVEYPNYGVVRLDRFNQLLFDLAQTMH